MTEPRFTIKVDGEDRTVFMSYGLLNELLGIVRGPEFIPLMSIDPDTRNAALTAALAPRTKGGKGKRTAEAFELEEVVLDPSEVLLLIEWMTEHVMGFFVTSLANVGKTTAAHQGKIEAMTQSLSGLQGLASKS